MKRSIRELLEDAERFGIPAPPKETWFDHVPGRTGRPPHSRAWKAWVTALKAARYDAFRQQEVDRGEASTLSWQEAERHRAKMVAVRLAECGMPLVPDAPDVRALWRGLAPLYPGFRCRVCGAAETPWKWADPALARRLVQGQTCWTCQERAAWASAPGVVDGVIGGVRVIA